LAILPTGQPNRDTCESFFAHGREA
jgi:hypothetical protein